ncbi:TPA: restriction endonuclease subunit S [Citrobacter freundii]|uniref:restriction endonuclease subunit S n=1 Tax=Citrobacter freundii TaxID=546 RepID=UPI00122FD4D5|nr:restriction endonuclease subunit S [Citrobacter freundii]KAA3568681.1 restriction endonuclease subunit S [Citrobacter freundii]MBA8047548.1 restriction endonuclease subunit S [Citrobacter freundii]MCR3689719.1 restriction endonuclease subunit S [Citrobacter freundii]HAT3774570.1 restriction endonuclease subunit S [Citrobacter freundii]HCQ6952846.1 restriction endonuclease subunit S [Citrobacter freundii]
MSLKNIPTNWCVSTIGDVNNYNSLTFNPKSFQEDTFELYSVPSFASGSPEVLLGKDIASNKQYIKFKDILLCKINPRINRVWCVKENTEFPQIGSSEWIVIRQPLIHEDFLTYFLQTQSFRDLLCSDVSGVGGSLTRAQPKRVATYHVPIAPFQEQKIIAEKLDTLLAQVDSTKARLEQIPQVLKRFRQAVLASATSGKLTETWRQNNNLRHPKEIIIDNIVESSFYGPRFSKNDYTFETNGIPTIRTTDMERGNIIITDSTPRVCVPNEKIEQLKVQKNDLLITRTGSIGVMALFTEDYIAIPSAYLIRFRFKKNINSKYIYLCLTAPKGQQQMGLSATAITQSNINAKSIRNINICYPDIAEQAEIVRRVEQLFAYADTIEKQVNNALTRVNSLTQSILAKAFRGELTAQWRAENPDLISGENSAAALLEKIKAERAASGGKKASRKKA